MSNYDQEDLLRDYAVRTLQNLRVIEQLKQTHTVDGVYETTQLINSLLGLIVLPVEQYFEQFPAISIDELVREGWKIPKVVGDFPQVNNLCELIRNLRNAVAHFNIKFLTDDRNQITGLEVTNKDIRSRAVIWQAEIGVDELRDLLERFVELILNPRYSEYERCYRRMR